ncbi:MAG TPA: response regulator [Geobacteraceae bacterium]
MKQQGILIADKDTRFLQQIAAYFGSAGYDVETTDSAIHVICSILKKQTPVLLLGSDFDRKIELPRLLHLLKKCNRHLAVILVSDEASQPVVRSVRREGIFYHALRPVCATDGEEIRHAVECAFSSLRSRAGDGPSRSVPATPGREEEPCQP